MPRSNHDPLEVLYLHPFPFGALQARGAAAAGLPTYPLIPMGVVGLCNDLQAQGHDLRGLNLPVERMVEPSFAIEDQLAARSPTQLVLIDLHWHEHTVGAVELATTVGRIWPDSRVVLGGLSASALAVDLVTRVPAVDAVIRGDAELPMRVLAASLARGEPWPTRDVPNLVTRAELAPPRWLAQGRDLDAVDSVDLTFLAHAPAYQRLLYSHPRRPGAPPAAGARGHWLPNGRGCAWDCAACGGSRSAHRALAGRGAITWRDPERVAHDLNRLGADGVQQVALGLDPDMAGAAHRDACLAEVLGLGLYLESFQLPSTALLDTVADRSGLDHSELAITAVSGASALRRRHGKDFDDDALLRCVDALQARRISCSIFFALGLPGEDDAAFAATMTLARRLLERDRSGTLRVAALPQALDPGARMGLDPAAWGMVPTGPGDLSARIDRGQRLAAGTLHPLDPSAMGYTVPGCDTRARAALWNTLAAEHPRAVMPTLGG